MTKSHLSTALHATTDVFMFNVYRQGHTHMLSAQCTCASLRTRSVFYVLYNCTHESRKRQQTMYTCSHLHVGKKTTHTHTHICQNPIPDYDVAVPLLSEQDILQHCLTAVVRTNDVSLSLCLSAFPPPLHQ